MTLLFQLIEANGGGREALDKTTVLLQARNPRLIFLFLFVVVAKFRISPQFISSFLLLPKRASLRVGQHKVRKSVIELDQGAPDSPEVGSL